MSPARFCAGHCHRRPPNDPCAALDSAGDAAQKPFVDYFGQTNQNTVDLFNRIQGDSRAIEDMAVTQIDLLQSQLAELQAIRASLDAAGGSGGQDFGRTPVRNRILANLTGYTADKVSPSGQLEPPSPKDFPNLGSNIIKLRPPAEPTLAFVQMPRPLQESNVIGKAGTAGFLGRAFDPYVLYPPGNDFDETKMDRVRADDLALRPELSIARLERRDRLRKLIDAQMPGLEQAVAEQGLDEYSQQALELVISGKARQAFELAQEPDELRDRYGRTTFGQSLLLARRFV